MIVKVSALAILSAMAAFMLRGFGWRGVPVFASVSFVGLISFVFPYISELVGFIEATSESDGLLDSASAAVKIIGVGYLAGVSADICRELEMPGAANAVIIVGRVEIIAIVTPFFYEIIKMGRELIL